MPNIAIEVEHVFKKFKKGELYDSLRDLIPALAGKIFKEKNEGLLKEREFWALHDVCFQVERGEAYGIIGSNGAGKSTILKLLSGIMKPTEGQIKVEGRLSALIEVSAGFHPDLSGRENIFLNGAILGMSRDEVRQRFDEIVAFSGLEEFIDTPVKRYSSGMFARLGFSVAAHVSPDILIVDEVLSVGDFVFQKKCLDRMAQVIGSGATVVFVSHNLRAVSDLCAQSLYLSRGRVSMIGPTDEVIRRYLTDAREARSENSQQGVFISDLQLRESRCLRNHFQPGERAYIEMQITSTDSYEKLAVVIGIKDADFNLIFSTSTERLGVDSFSIKRGETINVTFSLDLHLAPGTFHISAYIHRYDLQREYDQWDCAQTFFVSSDRDVRGIVNLYPEVTVDSAKEQDLMAG